MPLAKEQPVKSPGDLARKGKFKHGVDWCGARYRDFTVGPLTVEVDLLATATMPDWIDYDLIHRAYVSGLDEKQRAELKLDEVEVTKAEMRKALQMVSVRDAHQAHYRVVKFGAIPREQIPEAIGRLMPVDLGILRAVIREVDDAVDKFCEEDEADLAGSDAKAGAGAGSGQDDQMDIGA